MRSGGRLEGDVKAAVMGYLELRGDLRVWRCNVGSFKPQSGGFVSFGLGKGAADIICCQAPAGRLIGIEVKRERGGVLSDAQVAWGAALEAFGGKYIVGTNVAEVAVQLGEPSVRVRLKSTRVIPR
jgi:hypothetical protein